MELVWLKDLFFECVNVPHLGKCLLGLVIFAFIMSVFAALWFKFLDFLFWLFRL